MEKTKLGLKASLVAALCFILAYFGGYVIAPIAMAYVLICEENKWLKRMAVKAVLVMISFTVLSYAIDFLPDILDWFMDLVRIFKSDFGYTVTGTVSRILAFLNDSLYLVKLVVYILLVIFAAFGRSVRLPLIDKICDKCISND